VLDVVAGIILAAVAYAVFLGKRFAIPELDRRLAPLLALALAGIIGGVVAGCWVVYAYSAAT